MPAEEAGLNIAAFKGQTALFFAVVSVADTPCLIKLNLSAHITPFLAQLHFGLLSFIFLVFWVVNNVFLNLKA